jgi:hypothetical protein
MDQGENFDCSIWKVRYSGHQSLKSNLFFPSIIGVNMKYYLAGDDNNNIYFWKDKKQLQEKCGGILKGHGSMVYQLAVNKQ